MNKIFFKNGRKTKADVTDMEPQGEGDEEISIQNSRKGNISERNNSVVSLRDLNPGDLFC